MFKVTLLSCLVATIFGTALAAVPKLDGKIVGGKVVDIKNYPYQVSLRDSTGEHFCGGSIMDDVTIMTAAHCTDGLQPFQITIRAGSTYSDEGGQIVQVKEIRQHKKYNSATTENDIAILKLAKKLKMGAGVQAITITTATPAAGTKAVVTGWGALFEGDEETPKELRMVQLDVISNDQCQEEYGSDVNISNQMMCCQTLNKDSCQGDSGGPLVVSGKQVGVVSWGFGCADPNYPGVYVNLAYYKSWIAANWP